MIKRPLILCTMCKNNIVVTVLVGNLLTYLPSNFSDQVMTTRVLPLAGMKANEVAKDAADQLVTQALAKGTEDNITALVILLQRCENA